MAQIRKIWKCGRCGRIVKKPLEPSPWYPNGNSCGCFNCDTGCEWICLGPER